MKKSTMLRRITSEHPDYDKINELNNMLCILTNKHMSHLKVDVPSSELQAIEKTIKDELEKMLDGGVFRDWINRSE